MKQVININQYPPKIQQLIEEGDIDELANLIIEKRLKATKELLNFSDDCGETVKQRIKRKQRKKFLDFFLDSDKFLNFLLMSTIELFFGICLLLLFILGIFVIIKFIIWGINWVKVVQ